MAFYDFMNPIRGVCVHRYHYKDFYIKSADTSKEGETLHAGICSICGLNHCTESIIICSTLSFRYKPPVSSKFPVQPTFQHHSEHLSVKGNIVFLFV